MDAGCAAKGSSPHGGSTPELPRSHLCLSTETISSARGVLKTGGLRRNGGGHRYGGAHHQADSCSEPAFWSLRSSLLPPLSVPFFFFLGSPFSPPCLSSDCLGGWPVQVLMLRSAWAFAASRTLSELQIYTRAVCSDLGSGGASDSSACTTSSSAALEHDKKKPLMQHRRYSWSFAENFVPTS